MRIRAIRQIASKTWAISIAVCCVFALVSFSQDRATLTGKVANAAGAPIEHATVMVFSAGVKKGYSLFCPTCYADCGKRAITNAEGAFTIQSLSPDLVFRLLVVRDGFGPEFVNRVDPLKGAAPTTILKPRRSDADPAQVVRGRVVNSHGNPVRDVVIQPQALTFADRSFIYGMAPDLEPVAVTNDKGEFEIAHAHPVASMLLLVEARGMAPKLFKDVPTGPGRQTMAVIDGATISGRLVERGNPVIGEIALVARNKEVHPDPKRMGDPYSEIRIGTKPDGTFTITNVPAPVDWYIYGKTESIAARGATPIIECSTKLDHQDLVLGDIQIKPGHRLRGRVVLSDGKAIPDGMRVMLGDRVNDVQIALLPANGRFEFVSLRSGEYSVSPYVKGYQLTSGKNGDGALTIDHDVDDFVMVLDPRTQQR
jgi:hypothetical protein